MQRTGYRPSTTDGCVGSLKGIARHCDLLNPESVKEYLACSSVTDNRKQCLTEHPNRFYKWKRIPFQPPRYKRIETLPFIPLEVEVDQLIAGVNKKTAAFLQLIKETAARPGEAWNLRWIDVDPARQCIRISPEKGSRPRKRKVSGTLLAMLNQQPHRWPLVLHNPSLDPLESLDDFRRSFEEQRRRVSRRLQNPRIMQITFRTLRHFKATMEHHRTKDILHVMQLLGHRSIRNTLVYTHLVQFESDDWICRVAKNVQEATKLIETGFDYVTQIDGVKLFRKRK